MDSTSNFFSCDNLCADLAESQPSTINPGEALSSEKVKELAIAKFANHENNDKILKHLSEKLGIIDYDGCLKNGIAPWIYSNGESESYYDFRAHTRDLTSHVNGFLKTLPGVNVKKYEGSYLKRL